MHHPIPLSEFPQPYGLASEVDVVVFVHDFLATLTIRGSTSRAESTSRWVGVADLYFFSSDSFGQSINASVDDLMKFMSV